MTGPRSIAIVGMAGRFPGAPDVETLWQNVALGRSAAQDVARDRWPVPREDVVDPAGARAADRALSSLACPLDDFELDPSGLALPASLLPRLGRLARLTLRVGVDAWRTVGSRPAAERTSVILANIALPTDGASRLAEELFFDGGDVAEPLEAFPSALPAGLLARALGLGGGSFTLDAACASSLYAIHLACADLEAGRADAVLCGGVSLPQALYTQVGFSQLQALSRSGRCAPYDESADGLVVGEGAAMIVVRRLDDAVREGDRVLAVIRGVGLSNDVGGSLLSPDSEGQLRAMRSAYAQAGWRPHDVDLVEGHGTGTPRGDAVELESLAELWRDCPGRGSVLGSVKSNVGHLLTAAGAAGLCKVLAALRARELPPTAHAATPSAALRAGPFRVLTAPEPWERRQVGCPRRAAISGFGFGGINAHLLIEEAEQPSGGVASRASATAPAACAVAIVGMAAHVGRLDSLATFQNAVLRGELVDDERPPERWYGLDRDGAGASAADVARGSRLRGGWLRAVSLPAGRFRVPPNDVASLLPQQLLMLRVAGEALDDAGWSGRGPHLRAGTVIGLGLDLETTSFHLRWLARARVRAWATELGLQLGDDALEAWAAEVRRALGPPLDATRTLGALGGVVPSRVAREFSLGGPSFAVADDEASGLRAFEVAVRLLQRREVDAMLVGAVDLAGDVRAVLARAQLGLLSRSGTSRPFDDRADGGRIAEGAAALVVKRLDDAEAAGDRIYAVVRGVGASGGAALDVERRREDAYVRAAEAAYHEAGIAPSRVELVEAHGSGVAEEDAVEARALARVFGDADAGMATVAVSSLAGTTGQAGAAASMLSIVKAALCLHHQVLPPLGDIVSPTKAIDWTRTPFHLPRDPEAWLRNRADGPRVAAVASMGMDGSCLHAVLEEHGVAQSRSAVAHASTSRARPLGERGSALFLLRGAEDARRLGRLAVEATSLESLAVAWHRRRQPEDRSDRITRGVVASDVPDLLGRLARPTPLTAELGGSLALVFPGSGNHFVGMGRRLALSLPDVYRRLDVEVEHLAGHLQPRWVAPRRTAWGRDWEEDAQRELTAQPERLIVAQVAHGIAVHDALRHLGVVPEALIGYSLGESTALFASRTWRDRDLMFARTLASPLFRSQLCGERSVLTAAWGEQAVWRVVIVNRPADAVRAALTGNVALLIVNAPRECVIGGDDRDVSAAIERLGCEAIPLDAVPTVHLPLALAVRDEYRAHHLLPTSPPHGLRVYSGAWAAPYDPTEETAADSITECAVRGFDFPAVIERAWADGVRMFVEVGPQGSCTRMIGRILDGRPHLAISACQRGQDGYRTLLTAAARVAEAGGPVDLTALYGEGGGVDLSLAPHAPMLPEVIVGGARAPIPRRPPGAPLARARPRSLPRAPARGVGHPALAEGGLASFFATEAATASAHETFLQVSQEAFELHARLLLDRQRATAERGALHVAPSSRFERAACVEFATGKLERVLGPVFAEVDSFPTRVRLPDEPLMLVDRIVSVEGVMGTLGPGRVVTEHDVLENAWYLDGDRAPVCISVEAGQADLFLSAYLGIDRETRGERVYRLLDAKIVFHRDLPRPGECIRYDIRIDRFIQQADTWLFFFCFDGTIGGKPLITMFEGCAGFFSADQLTQGRGIVARTAGPARARRERLAGHEPFRPLLPADQGTLSVSDDGVNALRRGDLAAAFGSSFAGKTLAPSLRLPGGRLKLVDRIVALDLVGGSAGLGEVVGEADLTPDAWYLTCHFIDDQVMPGTLMYECCLHTLRVLLLRLGWVSSDPGGDVHYAPVVGAASELRCRGQVTRDTRKVRYRVTIDEIGYRPEPYVLATASMFADDKHVVQMDGMSVELRGLTRRAVEREWAAGPAIPTPPAFSRAQVVAYAEGKPSDCFGDPYAPFDRDRRLARLPRDPYLFVDRVLEVEPAPWVLEPGGWVTCAFDVAPDAWYFGASRQRTMPFAVLLEAALQPCGWLAAYLGSALTSEVDLHFRNLDGHGTQLAEVGPDAGTLTTRARLTKASEAGGMILQEFDLEVLSGSAVVYAGHTGFGFFPTEALAAQVGLRGAEPWMVGSAPAGFELPRVGPRAPRDFAGVAVARGLALPGAALSMIDRVCLLDLSGGPHGLGLIVGEKHVDPEEWFFRAHFYQDPVMPGSLGLEAVLELAKVFARERFPMARETHRFEAMALGRPHRWQYRGQVIQSNKVVRVEARVTALTEGPAPLIVLDGQLAVDGKIIYAMKDFAVRLVPEGGLS